jgi:predicted RNA polymerase sigma factor
VPLADQRRELWDAHRIAEGIALVSRTLGAGQVGPYQLQAAIAAVHDEAATSEATDWPQILALYGVLQRLSGDDPVVALNRVAAAAMVHGPATALSWLRELENDARLARSHRVAAVRAHLLEMSGDHAGAITAYRAAAGTTASAPERQYLLKKAARLEAARS